MWDGLRPPNYLLKLLARSTAMVCLEVEFRSSVRQEYLRLARNRVMLSFTHSRVSYPVRVPNTEVCTVACNRSRLMPKWLECGPLRSGFPRWNDVKLHTVRYGWCIATGRLWWWWISASASESSRPQHWNCLSLYCLSVLYRLYKHITWGESYNIDACLVLSRSPHNTSSSVSAGILIIGYIHNPPRKPPHSTQLRDRKPQSPNYY